MDYTIEFDKSYITLDSTIRIIIVKYAASPFIFKMVNYGGQINYYMDEYWLESTDNAPMDNLSVDDLVDSWFGRNTEYCWIHP